MAGRLPSLQWWLWTTCSWRTQNIIMSQSWSQRANIWRAVPVLGQEHKWHIPYSQERWSHDSLNEHNIHRSHTWQRFGLQFVCGKHCRTFSSNVRNLSNNEVPDSKRHTILWFWPFIPCYYWLTFITLEATVEQGETTVLRHRSCTTKLQTIFKRQKILELFFNSITFCVKTIKVFQWKQIY